MNPDDVFVNDLERFLERRAGTAHATYLAETLERTSAASQRPWWSSPERWLPVDLTATRSAVPRLPVLRLAVAALLILAVALALVLIAGSRHRVPPPFGPAANGDILSWANGDILVADKSGRGTRVLIGGPESDSAGFHTHDGTHVFFLRQAGTDLMIPMLADADGTHVRALAAAIYKLDWFELSPGDDRMLLVHWVDGRRVMSVLELATGAIRDVDLPGDAQANFDATWRPPSGAELVMTTQTDPSELSGGPIVAMRPDGSAVRTILGSQAGVDYRSLNLAPDGKTATYTYDVRVDGTDDRRRVHRIDLDSGLDRELRFDPEADEERDFVFAPDGKAGIVTAFRHGLDQVLYVTLDGSAPPKPIGRPFAETNDKAIGFSPDGRSIVVHFDNSRATFVDIATGETTTADAPWGRIASWQRLAMP